MLLAGKKIVGIVMVVAEYAIETVQMGTNVTMGNALLQDLVL